MDPVMIPILVPLGVFAMIFGLRYFENKERMSMIEKGMDPGLRRKKPGSPLTSLKWGLVLSGVGIGLMLAYWLTNFVLQTTEDQGTPIYFGLIAIFGGIGLITSYFFEKREPQDK